MNRMRHMNSENWSESGGNHLFWMSLTVIVGILIGLNIAVINASVE